MKIKFFSKSTLNILVKSKNQFTTLQVIPREQLTNKFYEPWPPIQLNKLRGTWFWPLPFFMMTPSIRTVSRLLLHFLNGKKGRSKCQILVTLHTHTHTRNITISCNRNKRKRGELETMSALDFKRRPPRMPIV